MALQKGMRDGYRLLATLRKCLPRWKVYAAGVPGYTPVWCLRNQFEIIGLELCEILANRFHESPGDERNSLIVNRSLLC
jgi:hypothetical protein